MSLQIAVSSLQLHDDRDHAVKQGPFVAGTAFDPDGQACGGMPVQAIRFAVIIIGRDGRINDWNAGAELLFGWQADHIRGEPVSRFFTAETQAEDRVAAEMQQALRTGRTGGEDWYVRKNGSRFWAIEEMTPLHDRDGEHIGFIKVLHDRTRDRQAMETQRADAEFLRGVLASSGDCIKVLDLDGRLTFMSDAGQRLMQVSDFETIRNLSWPAFWDGDSRTDA